MRNRLLVAAAAAAMLLAPQLLATPATAATGAVGCGATVTGSAYLPRDLTCAQGLRLTNGAVLDLRGHTLTGPGRGTESVGITVADDASASIRNGIVRSWGTAVGGGSGSTTTLDHVRLTENDNGVSLTNGARISLSYSEVLRNERGVGGVQVGVTVDHVRFAGNTDYAIAVSEGPITVRSSLFDRNGRGLSPSEGSIDVSGASFTNNTAGITAFWSAGTVRGSTFTGNRTGISADTFTGGAGLTVADSSFSKNATAVTTSENMTLLRNDFRYNVTALTSRPQSEFFTGTVVMERNYFTLNRDAVVLNTFARIKTTTAVKNAGWGIYAPRATDLGGNVAYGNGRQPQCVGVTCASS